jgi:hypothetical protein
MTLIVARPEVKEIPPRFSPSVEQTRARSGSPPDAVLDVDTLGIVSARRSGCGIAQLGRAATIRLVRWHSLLPPLRVSMDSIGL